MAIKRLETKETPKEVREKVLAKYYGKAGAKAIVSGKKTVTPTVRSGGTSYIVGTPQPTIAAQHGMPEGWTPSGTEAFDVEGQGYTLTPETYAKEVKQQEAVAFMKKLETGAPKMFRLPKYEPPTITPKEIPYGTVTTKQTEAMVRKEEEKAKVATEYEAAARWAAAKGPSGPFWTGFREEITPLFIPFLSPAFTKAGIEYAVKYPLETTVGMGMGLLAWPAVTAAKTYGRGKEFGLAMQKGDIKRAEEIKWEAAGGITGIGAELALFYGTEKAIGAAARKVRGYTPRTMKGAAKPKVKLKTKKKTIFTNRDYLIQMKKKMAEKGYKPKIRRVKIGDNHIEKIVQVGKSKYEVHIVELNRANLKSILAQGKIDGAIMGKGGVPKPKGATLTKPNVVIPFVLTPPTEAPPIEDVTIMGRGRYPRMYETEAQKRAREQREKLVDMTAMGEMFKEKEAQKEKEKQREKLVDMTAMGEMFKEKEAQKEKERQREKEIPLFVPPPQPSRWRSRRPPPTPQPPIPIIPIIIPPPFIWPMEKKKKFRLIAPFPKKVKARYAPSLLGVFMKRKAKRLPRLVTGFGIRPIVKRKRKKRR